MHDMVQGRILRERRNRWAVQAYAGAAAGLDGLGSDGNRLREQATHGLISETLQTPDPKPFPASANVAYRGGGGGLAATKDAAKAAGKATLGRLGATSRLLRGLRGSRLCPKM